MSSLGRYGRYEAQAVLGQGGMGVVYRAHDPQSGRQVAIKCLAGLVSAQRWERFRREGEVTAALSHPGIVRVHDLGVQDEQPYLVCELIEGARSLTGAAEGLGLRERIRLLRDAADALGAAHAAGVVHRDVKPDNLLVDAQGRVRVTDFGLAQIEGGQRLTRTGTALGTPSYMAPEQALAMREQVGPATDVWGLGVVLFELLTGDLPFKAANVMALGFAVANEEAPDPRRRRADVPAALAAVCWRALARETAQRYPDASALRADLDAWLEGRDPAALERFPRRRHRTARVAGLLMGLGLGAVALARLIQRERPAPPASAPTPRLEASAPTPPPAEPPLRLEQLARLDPLPRAAALASWLDRHPEDRQRPAALAAYQQLRRAGPLLRLRHGAGSTRGRFLDEGSVLSGDSRAVHAVALDHPRQPRLLQTLDGAPLLHLVPLPRGLVLIQQERPLQLVSESDLRSSPLQALCATAIPGERLLVGSADGRLSVLDADSLEPLGELPRQPNPIWELAVSPDGRRLAVSSGVWARDGIGLAAGHLLLFRLADAELLNDRRLPALARALAWSPDGSLLAAGTVGGQVYLCDGQSGEERYALQRRTLGELVLRPAAHAGSVRDLRFSPDGTRLYSLGVGDVQRENELLCWVLSRRQLLEEPLTQPHRLVNLDLSRDGRLLLLGTSEGTVDLWATPYEAP